MRANQFKNAGHAAKQFKDVGHRNVCVVCARACLCVCVCACACVCVCACASVRMCLWMLALDTRAVDQRIEEDQTYGGSEARRLRGSEEHNMDLRKHKEELQRAAHKVNILTEGTSWADESCVPLLPRCARVCVCVGVCV